MKELNKEIKLTLNLMQTDIDDGAHSELQFHLYNLLDMKRDELQKGLDERSWIDDQSPYVRGPIIGRATPLSIEELLEGEWWCKDVSKECADAFESKHLRVFNSGEWGCGGRWDGCTLGGDGHVTRAFGNSECRKQIYRSGNEFYWSKTCQ